MKRERRLIAAHRALVPGVLTALFCGTSVAQPTQLNKQQIPASTVYVDQSNTYNSGDQDFGTSSSIRIKTGGGVPLASDCNTGAKVGRVYARSNAASPNATLYVCANTGAGTFGWELGPGGVGLLVGGILAGTRSTINVVPGVGISPVTANDTGTRIDLTLNADTAVLATVANAVNFSGKKSFNVVGGASGLRLVPSALPTSSLTPGDAGVESTNYNLFWRDNSNQWRIPYSGISGSPCAVGQLLQAGSNFSTSCLASTGAGNAVLASAPIISNPVITSFVNSTHTHRDAGNGGPLTNATLGTGALTVQMANASSTGTTDTMLAKLSGAPSAAVISTTADTTGIIGVVRSGGGTSGNAEVVISGRAVCTFENGTVAGHYVIPGTGTAGNCRDGGASFPGTAQAIGRVLSTNASAGVYELLVFPPNK